MQIQAVSKSKRPREAVVYLMGISLEAITYMRGRSIPNQAIFIDEVQNLTPHEIKTLISRAGEGTKIILAGGLDASNVASIVNYGFYGVDVSSGVEASKGIKDPNKVNSFHKIQEILDRRRPN